MATHREIRQRRREIAQAYQKGEHFDSICARFEIGISYLIGCLTPVDRETLKAELKKLNRTEKLLRKTAKNAEIIRLHLTSMSINEISEVLQVRITAVRRVIDEFNGEQMRDSRQLQNQHQVEEIIALIRGGMTLREVGIQLNISGERVRQILAKRNIRIKDIRTERTKLIESTKSEINEWVITHPGCFWEEISEVFGIPIDKVGSLTNPKSSKFIVRLNKNERSSANRKFSRDEMLKAIQEAFQMRNPMSSYYAVSTMRPLTGPYYEKLRKSKAIDGPSQMRILQVFGTWRKACELAGVESVAAVRNSYDLNWTREQLVTSLATFLVSSDSHSIDSFDEWCRLDDARPSSGTIRNQVGPWSSAKREALMELRQLWAMPTNSSFD